MEMPAVNDGLRNPHRSRILLCAFFASVSLCCSGALLTWTALDASFNMAVWKAKVVLRIEGFTSVDPDLHESTGLGDAMRTLQWDSLGRRVVGLCMLTGIGLLSTAFLVFAVVRRFTFVSAAVGGIVIVFWATLFATHHAVSSWRVQRQVAVLLPTIQDAELSLRHNWPATAGKCRRGRFTFLFSDRFPNLLLLSPEPEAYPVHESLGRMVTRSNNGRLRFDLAAEPELAIEYHPNGTVPTAYISEFGNRSPPVAESTILADMWYLVRYGG